MFSELYPSSGTVDFNLSAMPLPAKRVEHCSLAQLPQDGVTGVNTDNLFDRKRMKGWWPAYDMDQEGTQLLKVYKRPSTTYSTSYGCIV